MFENYFGEKLPGRKRDVIKAARRVCPEFDDLGRDPYCGVELDTGERRKVCARNVLVVDEAREIRPDLGTVNINDIRKVQIRHAEDRLLFAEDLLIQRDQRETFGSIDVDVPEHKRKLVRGLFPHGLGIGPIVQGYVGNCSMIAGLAAFKAHISSPCIMAALIHEVYGGYVVDFNGKLSWMSSLDALNSDAFPIGPDYGDRILEVGTARLMISEKYSDGDFFLSISDGTQPVGTQLRGFSSGEFFKRFLPKGLIGRSGSVSLADFNPNMLCVVSECRSPAFCFRGMGGHSCLDPECEILSHHGYAIDRVEADNGVVVMTNPHRPYSRIRMTVERFNSVFSGNRQLNAVELDPSNFKPVLDNLFADNDNMFGRLSPDARLALRVRAHLDPCTWPCGFARAKHDLGVKLV